MAITTYSPKERRYGIAEQSVFGTAEIDSSAVIELSVEHPALTRGVTSTQANQATGSRNPIASEVVNHTKGAAPKFSYAGEAKHDEFDHILYNVVQKVTEGATTPFDKTYTFDQTTQPDFTADAGHFLTVFDRNPISGESDVVKDVITESLVISCAPGEYLKFTSNFIGRGAPAHNSTPSGTWTRSPNDFWHFNDISVASANFGSPVALDLTGPFEIAMQYTPFMVGQDSGDFKTFGLVERQYTWKVTVNHSTFTDTAKTAFDAGTQGAFRIGWGHATPGTDDGDLDFAWNGIITNEPVKITSEGIEQLELSGIIVGANATTDPLTIIMANAVDRAW